MRKVELMQEKITMQRQIPNEIIEKLNNITFKNLIASIFIMIFFIIINLILINKTTEFFTITIKTFVIIFAILDVFSFEMSYRKDKADLTVYSIELLCFNLLLLAITYIYKYSNFKIISFFMISPVYFSIYYIAKIIFIHLFIINKFRNSLSDIKEILEEEKEKQSYI